jgi:hypothetical protein
MGRWDDGLDHQALAKTDLYSYLCQDHEPTQIGIMLGTHTYP